MKRWKVDRVSVFLFITVVSFLYDLTAYVGFRDTARFPHPFVYFRSLGDIEALRGFPGMLRQAMFSLVAGGSIGFAVGLFILRNNWLTRATMCFLRIGMWIPFLVVFAAPYSFQLGIAATLLAAIYHYLTARSFLGMSARDAFPYVAGEVTLQAFFFTLISQIWVQRWNWMLNPVKTDVVLAIVVCGLIITVVEVIGWIFRRTFLTGCEIGATQKNQKKAYFAKLDFFVNVVLLTIGWLLFWHLTCVTLGYDAFRPIPAMRKVGDLLLTREVWYDMFTSLAEIGVGLFFGGVLSFAVATVMHRSKDSQRMITIFAPATYISPIVLWLLLFNLGCRLTPR
jgi:ABC-type nitrate/sulfonate/bicarbonate transport system permease component